MKNPIRKTISMFIVICYFTVIGFQDFAWAEESSSSEAPAETTAFDSSAQSFSAMGSVSVLSSGGGEPPAEAAPESLISNFHLDPYSGSAVMSLPLFTPPGRGGIKPNVGLSYSPTAGNGSLGFGWSVGFGSIQRSTKRGAPNYDNSDTFTFSLGGSSQELVEISSGEYRAKIESAFSKFTYNNDIWIVTDKKGVKYYLGQLDNSRQKKNSSDIYAWYLDKVIDVHGNYLEISYQHDQNQIYPQQILYTGNEVQFDTPTYTVEFTLENRPDITTNYRSGIKIVNAKRISQIQAKYNQNLVRKYTFDYEVSSSTGRSLLSTITQYGSDGQTSLPALTFDYLEKDSTFGSQTSWGPINQNGGNTNYYYIRHAALTATVDIFDINGDGLPDRVTQDAANTTWEIQLNNGTGFDNTTSFGPIEKANGSSDYYYIRLTGGGGCTKVDIFDINGDGLPDRVMQDGANTVWKVQLNNGSGFDSVTSWGPIEKANGDSGYYYIRYIGGGGCTKVDVFDINGDGLPDRVMQDGANTAWKVQLNNGSGFDSVINWATINNAGATADYYYVRFTGLGGCTKADIFDINGDGLVDRIMQNGNDSTWEVQLNNGSGFDSPINWTLISKAGASNDYYYVRFTAGGGCTKVDLADINADGLIDRVMQNGDDSTWEVQLNTGTGFASLSNWTPIGSGGGSTSYYYVRYKDNANTKADLLDLNGDGLVDRVMQNGADSSWEIQLNSDYLPDILVEADNGIGGTIETQYSPSTQFDNTGSDSIPDLPFPVPVVTSSTVSDGRGNSYQTTYEYQDGAYSWQEKEFRGFGFVKTIDPDGNYSESYFKQDDMFKARLYKKQVKDSSGNLYAKVENDWQSTEVEPGVDFVYLAQTDNYTYDGDSSYKKTTTTFQYDDYGNPTQVVSQGDVDISGDEKSVVTEYTHNTDDWLIGFAKHTTLYDDQSNKVSEKWFYYDGNLSIDDEPEKGLLTKEEVWLYNPITTQSAVLATQYAYDDYGNLTSTTNPKNQTITTQYDATLHIYPVQTQNPLSHTVLSTYDYKTGQVLTTTDPNNQTTENIYDVLARVIKVIGPLDNASFPAVSYEYDLSSSPIKVTKHTRIEHLESSIYTTYFFYDGLGRQIQVKSPAEDDSQSGNPQQVVSGTLTFDSRGKVKEKYFPYFVNETSDFSPPTYAQEKVTFDYDPVGRVIKTTNADSTFSTADYSDWVLTSTDENSHSKTNYLDAYGRVIKVEEHNQAATYTTTYEYDTQGNLVLLTDDQSNQTQIWYDSLGRKIKMDDPDMGIWTYEYDDIGNLISQTDAKSQVLEFDYDSINRLTAKRYPLTATTLVTYTYDDPTKDNCVGRLSEVDDQSGSTEFFYDELGRETQSTKTIFGTLYSVLRTYDALDRIKTITYPDSEVVTYTYNKAGAIETVSGSSNYVTSIDYSPTGQITEITYGNGAETSYVYNPQTLRLASLETTSSGVIQNLSYEFDNVGNIADITDSINTATQSFVYDDLDRLTQATGSYGTLSYDYDSIGNMTYKAGVNLSYGKAGKLPHAVTEYGSTLIDYDLNGNMVSKGAKTFTYDVENRLTEVDNNTLAGQQNTNLTLNPGWNFFCLPLVPASLAVSDVLSSIEGDYDQVTRYNPTTDEYEHYVGNPTYDDFDTFEFGRGYQIYITDPQGATLPITGTVPESANQTLKIGWNLIGSNSQDEDVTDILDGIEFTSLLRYNEATEQFEEYPGSFSKIEAGRAYYLQKATQQVWTIANEDVVATFEYDGDGGRVVKRLEDGLGGVLSATTYVGSLYEVTDGVAKKHIFAGSNRIASVEQSDTYYFHSDHLGSSNVVTNSAGAQVGHTEFKPYGETSTQSGTYDPEHKFTGKELDDSTDLYYYGARYYDPELGRFTQADTIVQAPYDPQSLNRYAYCRNNPLKYIDPTGHIFGLTLAILGEALFKAAIGAAIGAAAGAGIAAATGGDIGTGAITGAISGFAFGFVGGLGMGDIATVIGHTVAGGVSGVANAAVTGSDLGAGAAIGAITAGVTAGLSAGIPALHDLPLNGVGEFMVNLVKRAAMGAVIGGVTAEVMGGNFGTGAQLGAITTGIAYTTNCAMSEAMKKLSNSLEVDKKPDITYEDVDEQRFTGRYIKKWGKRLPSRGDLFLKVAKGIAMAAGLPSFSGQEANWEVEVFEEWATYRTTYMIDHGALTRTILIGPTKIYGSEYPVFLHTEIQRRAEAGGVVASSDPK